MMASLTSTNFNVFKTTVTILKTLFIYGVWEEFCTFLALLFYILFHKIKIKTDFKIVSLDLNSYRVWVLHAITRFIVPNAQLVVPGLFLNIFKNWLFLPAGCHGNHHSNQIIPCLQIVLHIPVMVKIDKAILNSLWVIDIYCYLTLTFGML